MGSMPWTKNRTLAMVHEPDALQSFRGLPSRLHCSTQALNSMPKCPLAIHVEAPIQCRRSFLLRQGHANFTQVSVRHSPAVRSFYMRFQRWQQQQHAKEAERFRVMFSINQRELEINRPLKFWIVRKDRGRSKPSFPATSAGPTSEPETVGPCARPSYCQYRFQSPAPAPAP